MKKTLKKSIVLVIIFVLTIANYGFAIEAIATESASVFETGIFKKSYVDLKAYFDDNEKTKEKQANVNDKVTITTVLSPKVDGLLKDGTLKLNLEDSDNVNFKITSVTKDGEENTENSEKNNSSSKSNNVIDSKGNVDDISAVLKGVVDLQKSEENNEEKTVDLQKDIENTATTETAKNETENNVVENTNNATENLVKETNTTDENATNAEGTTTDNSTSENTTTEEVNDEAKVIEQVTQEAIEAKKEDSNSEFSIASENEIAIKNMLKETKIKITIQYKQGDTVDISNLYKKLKLDLAGTFVNTDLEEIAISEESKLTLEWNYSKDIEVSSEYTKVSPFSISDVNGTIVKNEISVKREITDENYLPIKETNIKIQVPELKGKYPTTVSVNANKLMATKGEEFGAVTFDENNWNYDEKTHTLNISVKNENDGKAINTQGEDIYVVSYRYEDYISDANVQLGKDITVKVEEYSGKQNNIQEKKIKTEQEKEIDVGELITYSVGTTEEPINKGKINANYYSETQYETELKTIVNVNVLTSDMLDMILLKGTNDSYIDADGNVFNAEEDIKYKGVNFNYSEIKSILENNGTIDLLDKDGNIIYTMNSSNTTSDEEAKIELAEYTSNLQIRINSVKTNGNLTVEFVKVIQKSNFEPTAFSTFKSIKSKVVAEIKYVGKDDVYTLKEIETEKALSESYTKAKLSINKDYLTTTQSNENVELKVELNNNEETSDLYKNPYFEIVFPKYVKSVEIQSMNLVYENGLKVSDFQTETKGENVKLRVELTGTQEGFGEGNIGNSTSVVINCKIDVDEATPRKEDQIKLYYCNEAVTNYESQTKWTIGKQIPSSIIKSTNGFDAEVIEYQAPTGLIAVNTIKNYDGNASEIKSVKQGTVTKQIDREKSSQIAQMQITALNNTGNDCTDIVLVGRIPFQGNKNVITNEDLGTTTDTTIKERLKADGQNTLNAAIYYSANPDANKNLTDASNGWTQEITNISEMKSFLIVVDGTMKAGDVLKYTYDFEIPENLPYEAGIYGTFSAYYNNNSDVAVVYESTSADKVGLTTEAGPKVEANLSVDLGDGAEVLEGKRLKYNLDITNTGSIDIKDAVAKIKIPTYAEYVEQRNPSSNRGDYGFLSYANYEDKTEEENDQLNIFNKNGEITLSLGEVKAGEKQSYSFYLRAKKIPTLEEYASNIGINSGTDDQGCYYIDKNQNKIYIDKVPDLYIETKATLESSTFANTIESNTIKNKIKKANFISYISVKYDNELRLGTENEPESDFSLQLQNISGEDLKNVKLIFHTSQYMPYKSGECSKENTEIVYNENKHTVTFNVGDFAKDDSLNLTLYLSTLNIPKGEETYDCYFELTADGIETEYTTQVPKHIVKSYITASQSNTILNKQIKEEETFTLTVKVKNEGKLSATDANLKLEFPEVLQVESVKYDGDITGSLQDGNGGNTIEAPLPILEEGKAININITFKTKNIAGTDNTSVTLQPIISNERQDDITLEKTDFLVVNDKLTDEEDEEIRRKEAIAEEERQKEIDKANAQKESMSNNNNNNSNSNNENNSSDPSNDSNNNTNENTNNAVIKNPSNSDKSNNSENSTTVKDEKYTIGGIAWIDENKDGIRDDNETKLKGVKANLISVSDSKVVQTTETEDDGAYVFRNVSKGKYVITFEYDKEIYELTVYRKNGAPENVNSDVTMNQNSKIAITDQINVETDVTNIDIGLITSKVFDLKINKYLTHAKVSVKDKTKDYDFDNKEIAKVEIKAKDLKKAKVELEYTIVVENIGNIEGYVEKLVDYLGNDLTFEENSNSIWYLGNDGKLYTKNLDNASLKPGEKRELKLKLTKQMTEDNTGFVSNKAEIVSSYSNTNLNENTKNNSSVQNTAISVATGNTVQILGGITILAITATAVYMIYIGKIKIPKISGKKFYK